MTNSWREELSWAAGFYDGEGHTSATWMHKRFWQARVDITQADRRVLDRFRAAVGGLGTIYGPYPPPRPDRQSPRYQYVAVASQAQAVIAMIWKWLDGAKRTQARAALLRVKETRDHRSSRFQETCKRGHSLTEESNVRIYYQHGIRSRACRSCDRRKQADYRVRKLAHALLVAV